MNASWKLAAAILVLLPGIGHADDTPVSATHKPPKDWGPKQTTPGVHLETRVLERKTVDGHAALFFEFQTDGFPRDKAYVLWHRKPIGEPEVGADQVRINADGRLIRRLDGKALDLVIGLAGMLPAEASEYQLISTDGKVRAYVEIIPFPIALEAKGGANVWLRLVTPMTYALQGKGFAPGERVEFEIRSGDEVKKFERKAFPEGDLGVILLFPAVIGRTGGDASVALASETLTGRLDYKWGTALRPL